MNFLCKTCKSNDIHIFYGHILLYKARPLSITLIGEYSMLALYILGSFFAPIKYMETVNNHPYLGKVLIFHVKYQHSMKNRNTL